MTPSSNEIIGNDPAPRLGRADIAKRAARDLIDGTTVNLGIGIPALCADFLPDGVELLYHAENGILGFKELSAPGEGNPNLMDAGGKFPKLVPGMAFFDSVESFNLIRGGHIDVTVLGALQVSRTGDLANWMIPKRGIGSIGGAMDLAENSKRVVIAMEHNARGDIAKIGETAPGWSFDDVQARTEAELSTTGEVGEMV
jgi:3-oxoacid CoA-transferase subunit B